MDAMLSHARTFGYGAPLTWPHVSGWRTHMTPDDLLSRTRLADQAGVSATTLKNWSERADRPLQTIMTQSGAEMYSWRLLLTFCEEHPELRGVETVMARSRKLFHPDHGRTSRTDQATLRAALRDLKTAVERSVAATVRSAQLAEETAKAHAEVVAALRDTIRAYDSAMTSMTAPEHVPRDFA